MAQGLATRKLTYVCILALGMGALVGAIVVGQQPPTYPPLPTPPPGSYQPAPPLPTPPPGSYQPHPNPPSPPPGNFQPQPPGPNVPQKALPENPLDQPLRWLYEARRNYTQVRDYTCTLRKQERVNRVLQDENIILFSYREKPFSVHMKWLAPSKFERQEVIYVQGQNQGNMRVKSRGPLGGSLLGWINVSPTDPRVLQHSRHTITEAGIGNMIEQFIRNMENERQLNKTIVRTADYGFDGRRCIRVETIRPQRLNDFYSYRTLVFLDKESKLPIRMENFDWPIPGGPEGGELLERFSYYDLHFNVGLREELFTK